MTGGSVGVRGGAVVAGLGSEEPKELTPGRLSTTTTDMTAIASASTMYRSAAGGPWTCRAERSAPS
jgi:hypothetical protein